jgi:hypothetical protein
MKGTIVVCVKELVEKKFGKPAWEKALAEAGTPGKTFLASADVPDATVLKILTSLTTISKLSMEQLMEAFGDFWVNDYGTRVYGAAFVRHASAMDFLLGLDDLHTAMTKTIPNARPPRFRIEKTSAKTLVLAYQSPRKLGAMVPGLVRGVARKYGTPCTVRDLGGEKYEVSFP